MLSIERADLSTPDALALIRELDRELTERYPEPGANHFEVDPDEVAPGRGALFLARLDGAAVGCGALRLLDPSTAEIKRMFTLPSARGRGVARAVLGALEAEARRLAVTRLVLETGERQPEAVGLYEAHGFFRIPPFGEYVGSPLSVCMAKTLGPA